MRYKYGNKMASVASILYNIDKEISCHYRIFKYILYNYFCKKAYLTIFCQ